MIGFVVKVVAGGIGVYGVAKFLERTHIVENLMTMGTEVANGLLSKLAEDAKFQQIVQEYEKFKSQNNQSSNGDEWSTVSDK